jgi:UDP-N-acetylmuramoyl-L-alanyl-D-glutamate--2,6-diaminopimelate ligase
VVVDYAHTPDALDKALAALRPWPRRAAAAGLRVRLRRRPRRGKRPLMGAAARLADRVVVTSDNPRSEDPRHHGRHRRGRARCARHRGPRRGHPQAMAQAGARDVVLMAGKGHEDYQDVAGVRRPSRTSARRAALLERAGL